MARRLTATLALIALGLAVALLLASDSSAGPEGPVLALDADTSGNGPRTVAGVQQCLSASVGQPVDIDIVLPGPGVAADRGIAAYQFTLFYDPAILWVQTANSKQLLSQAPGSSLVDISDPTPDKNGVYISWGVDFGPKGIEPAGASEAGPGVISRLTLIPRGNGASDLDLTDVALIDDASQAIAVGAVRSGAIRVGQPCPGQEVPTPSPSAPPSAPPTATPAPATGPPAAASFGPSGGAPTSASGPAWGLIAGGLFAGLSGAALLAGAGLAPRASARRHDTPESAPRHGNSFPVRVHGRRRTNNSAGAGQ